MASVALTTSRIWASVRFHRQRPCCPFPSPALRPGSGMVIVNAHRLTDSSGEAFAVRLYRTGNASGFVRAVSDQPTAFTAGFNKVRGAG